MKDSCFIFQLSESFLFVCNRNENSQLLLTLDFIKTRGDIWVISLVKLSMDCLVGVLVM